MAIGEKTTDDMRRGGLDRAASGARTINREKKAAIDSGQHCVSNATCKTDMNLTNTPRTCISRLNIWPRREDHGRFAHCDLKSIEESRSASRLDTDSCTYTLISADLFVTGLPYTSVRTTTGGSGREASIGNRPIASRLVSPDRATFARLFTTEKGEVRGEDVEPDAKPSVYEPVGAPVMRRRNLRVGDGERCTKGTFTRMETETMHMQQ